VSALERSSFRPSSVVEVGLALLFAAALAAQALFVADAGGSWAINLLGGAAICALALSRRRDPIRAAALGIVVAAAALLVARLWHLPTPPNLAGTLGLCVLACAALRVASPAAAAAIAVGGAMVVLAGRPFALPVPAPVFGDTRALGWAAVVAAGLWLRQLDSNRRAEIEDVRREERLELARELHDAVAHHVTGIVLGAQSARILAARRPDEVDGALAQVESAGADALVAMRRLVGLLRDPEDSASLAPGTERLSELVGRFAADPERTVRLELPDGPPDLDWPPEFATTVYRIVQEGLTNIARHAAGARAVAVTIGHDAGRVTVAISDDAPIPRRPRTGAGYGLIGMRERVAALGGTLDAGPLPRAGWMVRASLPSPTHSRP
jgi:signal transduction histidine kinase